MNKSIKFWDRIAKNYDNEEKKDRPVSINIVEKSKKYLKSSDTVLDFGCATGKISNEIAKSVKTVYAIDISAKMIAIARKRVFNNTLENVEFDQTTILDEKFENDSFDAILGFYIFHLVEDVEKTFQRIKELLKPGGLIISATPCMGESSSWLRVPINIGSMLGIVPKVRFLEVAELEKMITEAGFEIVETERLHKSGDQHFIVAQKI